MQAELDRLSQEYSKIKKMIKKLKKQARHLPVTCAHGKSSFARVSD